MSTDSLTMITLVASLATLGAVAVVLSRRPTFDDAKLRNSLLDELRAGRKEASAQGRDQRTELRDAYTAATKETRDSLGRFSQAQQESVGKSAQATTEAIDKLRESIATSVKALQDGNEAKLEQMRVTVDEKLQGTLEKRLGESFRLVSERLEAVQRGLGEMQALAVGVGDLKKVLSNVSTRGSFGEVQLHAILDQILAPDQYIANFSPRADEGERVEYAVVFPGRNQGEPVYLPIDSKFPQEDYLRLVDAMSAADPVAMAEAQAALLRAVKSYAQDVHEKYVNPPVTTDIAIVFLPTEGLFAEVLRHPGVVEELQRQYSIVIAGPTTLAAMLNSFRMGFRTLALEERSSEVWQVLAAVKTEFGKFGEVIAKVKKQLNTASKTLDDTSRRTRAMERKLADVEQLPADLSAAVIGLTGPALLEPGDEDPEPDEGGEAEE